MWPFLVFGGLYVAGATLGREGRPSPVPWLVMFVITVLFVGLRHHVGMDWNNYLRMIHSVGTARNFWDGLSFSEPLYGVLLAIGHWSGGGVYVVNLISTFAAMLGLFALARRTPAPWIALIAAMPMFIVVVAMSANRQALAAGLIMLLISRWERFGLLGRAICILVIAGFHASALVFLAFVAIDLRLPRVVKLVGMSLFSLLGIMILQQSGMFEYYNQSYGTGQTELTQSSGAIFHVMINAIPASLYFLLPRSREVLFPTSLLRNLAFAALLTVPLASIASVAAGRLTLYWFPVSMWVWAAFPSIVGPKYRAVTRMLIALAMFAVMYAWLTLANSSFAHLPYNNALFMQPWELEIGVLP